MATVKLATGRPIINHPHYEDAGIRLGNIFDRFAHFQPAHAERETKQIYTVYSRRSSATIHATLRDLQADYVIVEDSWCHRQYRPGCAFHEVINQSRHEESRKMCF